MGSWSRSIDERNRLVYQFVSGGNEFGLLEEVKSEGFPSCWGIYHMGRAIGTCSTLLRGMDECEALAEKLVDQQPPQGGRLSEPIALPHNPA